MDTQDIIRVRINFTIPEDIKYFCNYRILNIQLAHYLVNEFNISIKIQIQNFCYFSIFHIAFYVNTHVESLCSIYNSYYAVRNLSCSIKIPVFQILLAS